MDLFAKLVGVALLVLVLVGPPGAVAGKWVGPGVRTAACLRAGQRALPVAIAVEGVARQTSQPEDLGDGVAALVVGPLGGGKNHRLVVGVLDLDHVTAAAGVWHVGV